MNTFLEQTLNTKLTFPGKISRKRYYLIYSLVFLGMISVIFARFLINGKTFIWQEDGWSQHYKALVYYAKWLRSIIRCVLFEHTLDIPQYSFSIGYGSDVVATLHYYTIGDPFSVLSVVVPVRYMAYYYGFMIILRFYLAGIAFSEFCFYKAGQMRANDNEPYGKMAVLAGSFIYVFCGFALYGGVRHPYFLNPMIFLPLLLLGAEKILDKEKPFLFIMMVFISAVSNFYFFYILAALTVMYVVWRLFSVFSLKEIKKAFLMLFKFAGYAILGVGMSAIILIPVIYLFLAGARSESNYTYGLFYTLGDYENNIANFLKTTIGHDWTSMGYASIALVAIIVLFMQRKKSNMGGYKAEKIAFIILTLMVLLPVAGRVMNGFSYATNRWIFGYSFFIAFIVVLMWKKIITLTAKNKCRIFLWLGIYLMLLIIFPKARKIDAFFAMAVVFLSVGLVTTIKKRFGFRWAQAFMFACILVNITVDAMFLYSPRNDAYIKEFIDYDSVMADSEHTEEVAIESVASDDDGFFRYSGSSTTPNGTLYSGLHSTQYYWSLENGYIAEFFSETGLCDKIRTFDYKTLDSRTILSTLANVSYYVQNSNLPYGFSLAGTVDNYSDVYEYIQENSDVGEPDRDLTADEEELVQSKITTYQVWKNDYALPFGYTYDGYISREAYDAMTPLEKQEALLMGCVIDGDEPEGTEITPTFTGTELEYDIEASDGVTIEDGMITVTKSNATVTLTFAGVSNAETYLYIEGLAYTGISPEDRYSDLEWALMSDYERNEVEYSDKYYEEATTITATISAVNTEGESVSNTLTYNTPEYGWYANREDFMVNLYYDEYAKTSITIKFPTVGEYTFDALEVLCQPMDDYPEQVAALAEDTMENVDFHENAVNATNLITGTISLDEDKYLLLTIPYSEGWTAYVDGEETELLQANTMYMALWLPAGEHDISLVYNTPGSKAGMMVSGISIVIFIGCVIYSRKRHIPLRRKIKKTASGSYR